MESLRLEEESVEGFVLGPRWHCNDYQRSTQGPHSATQALHESAVLKIGPNLQPLQVRSHKTKQNGEKAVLDVAAPPRSPQVHRLTQHSVLPLEREDQQGRNPKKARCHQEAPPGLAPSLTSQKPDVNPGSITMKVKKWRCAVKSKMDAFPKVFSEWLLQCWRVVRGATVSVKSSGHLLVGSTPLICTSIF